MVEVQERKDVKGVVFTEVFENAVPSWFYGVIESVKELQDKGERITDLLLREGASFGVGILKHFFNIPFSKLKSRGIDITKISRRDIREIAVRLLTLKLSLSAIGRDDGSVSRQAEQMIDGAFNGVPVKFSLSVQGIGSMRFIFAVESGGPVLNVRLLDFLVPSVSDVRLSEPYLRWLNGLLEPVRVKPPFLEKEIDTHRLRRGGLIVHCGPTGSGKTTSIAAQIAYLAERISGLIVTYEHPVEYVFVNYPNVLQHELAIHVRESEVYHHFLRMSAEVALVGEVKEKEEIFRAVDLASRGHLVYTTVHANSVEECLYLLKEHMKDNMPLLLSSLLGITSQRLVLVPGRGILPVYRTLVFYKPQATTQSLQEDKGASPISVLFQMLESGKTMQEIRNYIGDKAETLKREGYYFGG